MEGAGLSALPDRRSGGVSRIEDSRIPAWLRQYLRESATSLGEGASVVRGSVGSALANLASPPLAAQLSGDPEYQSMERQPLDPRIFDLLRAATELQMILAPVVPVRVKP